jgi:hypothetical protein
VINIADEFVGYHQERAYANVRRIFDTTAAVFSEADRRGVTPVTAAENRALERIERVGGLSRIRTFDGRGRQARAGRPGRR